MPSGKLGTADLAATTLTTVYTCPGSKTGSCIVRLTNRTSNSISVRVAHAATDTPALSEWLEYDFSVVPNGVLEVTGLVLATSQRIVTWASAAGVSVNVYGYED
jgi:sugar/nucleoside kinase (ribokinase family)